MGFFDKYICDKLTEKDHNYNIKFNELKKGVIINTNIIKKKKNNIESNVNFGVEIDTNNAGDGCTNLCFANDQCALLLGGKTQSDKFEIVD